MHNHPRMAATRKRFSELAPWESGRLAEIVGLISRRAGDPPDWYGAALDQLVDNEISFQEFLGRTAPKLDLPTVNTNVGGRSVDIEAFRASARDQVLDFANTADKANVRLVVAITGPEDLRVFDFTTSFDRAPDLITVEVPGLIRSHKGQAAALIARMTLTPFDDPLAGERGLFVFLADTRSIEAMVFRPLARDVVSRPLSELHRNFWDAALAGALQGPAPNQ